MADSYDVGVLVVHGIGTQAKGTTLRGWVDPVVTYLAALKGDNAEGVQFLSAPAEDLLALQTPPLPKVGRQKWVVGEAWWADAFDAPSRGEVTKWLIGAGPWFIYFFAARLWKRFSVRRFAAVIGLAIAIPLALLAFGISSARDACLIVAGVATALAFGWALRCGAQHEKGGAAPFIAAATVLVVLPIAAVASALMIVLYALGLIPGAIGAKVRKLQLSLNRTLGDAFVLISSPRRERAMFDAITAALEKLKAQLPNGEPIVIVAHSQGAALTFRLFERDRAFLELLRGRQVTLATHGSAVLPIHVLAQKRESHPEKWWERLQGAAGIIGLLLLVSTFGRLVSDTLTTNVRIVAVTGAALATVAFMLARRDVSRSRCAGDQEAHVTNDDRRITRIGPGHVLRVGDDGEISESALLSQSALAFAGVMAAKDAKDAIEKKPLVTYACPMLPVPEDGTLRWVDTHATWDPVPNGQLDLDRPLDCDFGPLPPLDKNSKFVSCRAAQSFQPWRDHTIYTANFEEIVSRWVGEVALQGAGPDSDNDLPQSVERPPWSRQLREGEEGEPEGAEAPRRFKRVRGVVLLSGQGAVLLAAIVAGIIRSSSLDDLGREAIRYTPARNLLAPLAGGIPNDLRDVALGAHHDPTRIQGVVVAIVLTAIAAAIGSLVNFGFASRASRRYLAGRKTRWMLGVFTTVSVFAATVVGIGVVAWRASDEGPARLVTIKVHHLREAKDENKPDVTVTFQPLGYSSEAALKRSVHLENAEVFLDPDLAYVATAEAAGGRDCYVELSSDVAEVSCKGPSRVLPSQKS